MKLSTFSTGPESLDRHRNLKQCVTTAIIIIIMPSDSPQHYGYILSSSRAIGDAVPAFDPYALARPNNAPFASGTPQPPGSNRTTQRLPKTKPDTRTLTKSISSPHLRGPIMSESELDKKRNKLGYQRISIACGKRHAHSSCRAPTTLYACRPSTRPHTHTHTFHPVRPSVIASPSLTLASSLPSS